LRDPALRCFPLSEVARTFELNCILRRRLLRADNCSNQINRIHGFGQMLIEAELQRGFALLRGIDALFMCSVINRTTTAPPGSPANGDAYIVATGGTGAWATHDKSIAIWTTDNPVTPSGLWEFYAPTAGLAVPYTAAHKPRPRVGVVLGKLHPQDDDSVTVAAFVQRIHAQLRVLSQAGPGAGNADQLEGLPAPAGTLP
jgi:hypothetical protein